MLAHAASDRGTIGHHTEGARPRFIIMRLLIVEDEPKAGDYLLKGLTESGFVADLARSGPDGLYQAMEHDYDLIVLDVMLPGMDGWQVIRELRRRKTTPVLFLTARDELSDRLKGLELGADDYLVKPFAFAELVARVHTILRRGPMRESEVLEIADLTIDTIKRRVTRAGRRIDLTAKEYALLHLLARRTGEVLSRSLISSQVWDVNFDSNTNVVDVAIRRLRAKVDDPFEHKLIHTLRGMGYDAGHGGPMMRWPASLAARLVLAFVLVAGVMLTGAGTYLYYALNAQLRATDDAMLLGKIVQLRHCAKDTQSIDDIVRDARRYTEVVSGHED